MVNFMTVCNIFSKLGNGNIKWCITLGWIFSSDETLSVVYTAKSEVNNMVTVT